MTADRNLKIAIAQINTIVGDFEGNLAKHLDYIAQAKALGARLVVFPEASFVGYQPRDLLLEPGFLQKHNHYFHMLTEQIDDIYVLVGCIRKNPSGVEKPFFNSALLIHKKKIVFEYDKKLLPTYGIFDERRYFEPGTLSGVFELDGVKIGLSICEDMWQHTHAVSTLRACYRQDPIKDLLEHSCDLLINMSGSPYYQDKIDLRRTIVSSISHVARCPMIYVNHVGGSDAAIFDGYSFVMHPDGKALYAKGFCEDLLVYDLQGSTIGMKEVDHSYDLEKALVLGLEDYVYKNGFKKAVVGVSGGIDSAVVLALAVQALGKDHVKAVFMPSKHTSPLSHELALKLCLNLGVSCDVISIDPILESYIHSLKLPLNLGSRGIAIENLQSRIRGNILMAYANAHGALMLGCSNKSELSVGYGTLYGDIAGSLMPIGDLLKVDVYKIGRLISRGQIPEDIFTRAPSAELYLNQLDSDLLPPYEVLDPILNYYIHEGWTKDEIVEKCPEFAPYIDKVLHLFKISEFKRQQLPTVLKVSKRNFGTGWDFPITKR